MEKKRKNALNSYERACRKAEGDIGSMLALIDDVDRQIAKVIDAEMRNYPMHFRASPEQKARLLLNGFLEGGNDRRTRHWFPERGSYLERECLWCLISVLRSGQPPTDVLQQVAATLVPDDDHGLAHSRYKAGFSQRRPGGATEDIYFKAEVVAIVEAAQRDKRGTEAGVRDAQERYGISREHAYRMLSASMNGPPKSGKKSSNSI
ncbi:hypothetical protein ACWGTO_00300 [Mesorhizobium sp. PL10]